MLSPDRFLPVASPEKEIARALYTEARKLPLVCPHGHVDPRLFADKDFSFGSPTELFITPDHYIFRMLYSQGISLDELGIKPHGSQDTAMSESAARAVWQTFADNFYLFRATPTSLWLQHSLAEVFGVSEKLNGDSAQRIYDAIAEKLTDDEFRPRALYKRFNIEVLATTDAATDTLEHHQLIKDASWDGRVIPTFRPDALFNLDNALWHTELEKLAAIENADLATYKNFITAIESRRAFFKQAGATATDHAALTPYTERLSEAEAEAIFARALKRDLRLDDAARFTGHLLIESARMSIDDGLVMQLHTGSLRNHNAAIYQRFGLDKGADIPLATEFTRNLQPLLNLYGNDARLTLILFTLDETTYARELAPLAGHYPCLRLGPPWWFHDSLNGMRRFFDEVIETAGLYNTAGFNDDTRAFTSIPARHDVWRRAVAGWLAQLVARDIIDRDDATAMMFDAAYGLARQTYKLDAPSA